MLKKILGIALCLIALSIPVFAAEQPKVDAAVDQATIQGYIPLWTNGNTTLYADPAFIRYGKSSDPAHKEHNICAVSTLLTTEGEDIATGNLVIYDLNCVTKKTFYEKIVDVKKNKKVSEQNFKKPVAVPASAKNTIAQEVARLKEIEQLQTFNNAIRYGN
ncbi:MAG: hypothetical protein Q4D21_07000 [Phascolarctobacterium sp.]|nr:hypothetical protein [Phascolarctobacterium sp.]